MAQGLEGSAKERLAGALQRVIALRRRLEADPAIAQRWRAVKSWQSQRLQQTYPDLLASPRYGPACRFFLDELYGAKDFSQRDNEALRVVPKLARMLPDRAIETMALAVELDELSETLDARVAGLIRLPIDEAAGLGHLHRFLASGFDSFKAMGDAGEFLATIRERETALMRKWFGD